MNKQEKIQEIRKILSRNQYPLELNKSYSSFYNCYAYAIGSTFKDVKNSSDSMYNLGYISQAVYPPNSMKEAEKAFKADMEVLGIECRNSSLEEEVKDGEWKVALFFEDWDMEKVERIMTRYKNENQKKEIHNYLLSCGHDFHMIRQNRDGSWSHKLGMQGHIECFCGNPEEASDLDFVGYYILKLNNC